ncbi:MAG: colicin V production protein [Desulfobacteraceae bacterium 4572_89]|nr:MAG: colicin V production protein [Desulfobacteraceae bacterium 4572_89]
MNAFDVLVLAIISFCLIRGLFKGLIREVSGIIGVVAGFYGANNYYFILTPFLEPLIEKPGTRNLVAFFILFCIILIFVGLVAVLIRKFLNLVFLGWVDRSFGFVFGGVKGILIGSALFIMMTTFIPDNSRFLSDSKSAPHVAKVAGAMTLFVSKNMKTDFLKHLEGIKANWKQ